jgi:FkbM family methyltransferase
MRDVLISGIAKALIPCARLAVQRSPCFRRSLWSGFVAGRLSWRDYPFRKCAHFGAVFTGNTIDTIQRHIYYFNRWDPEVETAICARLKPGDTFIDIGANIGYFSLLASKLVGPCGHVVSIEASASTFAILNEHLEGNAATGNVRAIHAAVADQEGTFTLHTGPKDNCGMASLIRSEDQGCEELAGAPLGALLSDDEMRTARLIKIDVEGAEGMVIDGMLPVLPKLAACEILIEISPELTSARSIINTLVSGGWRPYVIEHREYPDNYLQSAGQNSLTPLRGVPESKVDVLFRPEATSA